MSESKEYDALLEKGTNDLLKFKNDNTSTTETNIETSLVQPYLDQMIELNKYMYTHASTNNPGGLFQPFFLDAIIHKKYITPKFLEKLKEYNFDYTIYNCSKTEIFEHRIKNGNRNNFLLDCLTMWYLNKNIEVPYRGIPSIVEFRNNLTSEFPEKFRKLFVENKCDFRKTIQLLSEDDYSEIDKLKRELNNASKIPEAFCECCGEEIADDEYGFNCYDQIKNYCENYSVKGELYNMFIQNLYDPTSDSLYSDLLDILKN